MTYVGNDRWIGYWIPGGYLRSHFFITVRAKSDTGIYGYDTIQGSKINFSFFE